MRRRAFLYGSLAMLAPLAAVEAQQRRPSQEAWNEVFTKRQGREFPHNKFLAETIKEKTPGKALDIGIGEGRNAIFLASQGWEVTGFDISDVGVKLTRAAAQKRGVKVEALVEDADRFDYGRQRWDLVLGMYMHAVITRNAEKIIDSLKPGGIIVVEGFHRDLNRQGLQGSYMGYQSNELLKAFNRLRVLHYEDTVGPADWGRSGHEAPIVRFIAVREQGANDSR
jgi:2-polyprenyl-3-methyl-5-hydroxy-6-metoxy-1,4-benzoquinol methylase